MCVVMREDCIETASKLQAWGAPDPDVMTTALVETAAEESGEVCMWCDERNASIEIASSC